MANQETIAKQLGISQRAVSFALNGKLGVSGETRKKILETAERLGYRPNSAARVMRSKETHSIGVIMHDAGEKRSARNHTFEFIVGINSVLEPAGYVMSLAQMTNVESSDMGMKRVFTEHRLDGAIVLASLQKSIRERIGQLMGRCIWCDSGVRDDEGCLWRDEVAAGRLAAQALIDAGYRKLLWMHGYDETSRLYRHTHERGQGLMQVVKAAGVKVEEFGFETDEVPHRTDWMARMSPEVGVVVSEYQQAPQVAHTACLAGLRVGRDFGLACCDDSDEIGRQFPQLSRALYDRFEMGRRAARMMIQRITRPDDICASWVDRPVWIEGQTAKPGSSLKPA